MIGTNVAIAAQSILLFDRAGWRTTPELRMPANVPPIRLNSRSLEANPVENKIAKLPEAARGPEACGGGALRSSQPSTSCGTSHSETTT
jgi:hypothetical protein